MFISMLGKSNLTSSTSGVEMDVSTTRFGMCLQKPKLVYLFRYISDLFCPLRRCFDVKIDRKYRVRKTFHNLPALENQRLLVKVGD